MIFGRKWTVLSPKIISSGNLLLQQFKKPKPVGIVITHFLQMAGMATSGTTSTSRRKAIIGVCQMTSTSSKADNLKTVEGLVASAKAKGAEMVFLPEACDYIGESRKQTIEMAEPLDGHFITRCKELAQKHEVWLSVGGFHQKASEESVEKTKNTHVVIDSSGTIKATYSKAHLFDLDLSGSVRLMESDFVIPGDKIVPPVTTPAGRVGLAICYDMRFPELSLILAQQGSQILTFPSAFTQVTGMAHWETLLRSRAIETQCYVVAAAQTGKHNAKRTSYGHAMVVDPWGAVIAQCSEGTGVAVAEVNLDYLARLRQEMPVWQHRRTDLYGRVEPLKSEPGTVHPDDMPHYQFGPIKINASQVFYRTSLSYAFVNIKPVLAGHMLVAPLRTSEHLTGLTPAEVTDMFMVVQKVGEATCRHFQAEAMTVAIQDGKEAGQTVKHVHAHVLPRKPGDFEDNDDVYSKLGTHDQGWTEETKLRTAEEMAAEALDMRKYFYPEGHTAKAHL